MKRWGIIMRVQKSDPRRDASSTDRSQSPKQWSAFQGNIPRGSTGKDTHPEGTTQMRTMKYLRESYYHCITTTALNAL